MYLEKHLDVLKSPWLSRQKPIESVCVALQRSCDMYNICSYIVLQHVFISRDIRIGNPQTFNLQFFLILLDTKLNTRLCQSGMQCASPEYVRGGKPQPQLMHQAFVQVRALYQGTGYKGEEVEEKRSQEVQKGSGFKGKLN